MIKKYLSVALSLGLLSLTALPISAAAEPNIALCNGCDDRAMRTQAIKAGAEGGKVHVINISGDSIKAFRIEREHDLVMVKTSSVSPTIEKGVEEIKKTLNVLQDISNASINIEHLKPYLGLYAEDMTSAYALAKSTGDRFEVEQAISAYMLDSFLGSVTVAITALGTKIVDQVIPATLGIKVNFPDGTTYTFIFKGLLVIGEDVEVLIASAPLSGKDGTVKIPEIATLGGYKTTVMNVESLSRLIEYLRLTGVKIAGDYVGSGGTVVICDYAQTCKVKAKP
jgi:hypothetical protein